MVLERKNGKIHNLKFFLANRSIVLKRDEVEHCHCVFVDEVFVNCFLVWHLKIVVVYVRNNNQGQNSVKTTLKTVTYILDLLKSKDFGDLKSLKIF